MQRGGELHPGDVAQAYAQMTEKGVKIVSSSFLDIMVSH